MLEKDISDASKQKIATEMNLSETAFVVPAKVTSMNNIGNNENECNKMDVFQTMSRFSLRWFTPSSEVPLCGHATLATAAVLFFAKNNQQVYNHFHPTYFETNKRKYNSHLFTSNDNIFYFSF